jgi:hypothetical protein
MAPSAEAKINGGLLGSWNIQNPEEASEPRKKAAGARAFFG